MKGKAQIRGLTGELREQAGPLKAPGAWRAAGPVQPEEPSAAAERLKAYYRELPDMAAAVREPQHPSKAV